MKLFLAGLIAGASMMLAATSASAATSATIDFNPNLGVLAGSSISLVGGGSLDAAIVSGNSNNVYLSPFSPNSAVQYFAAGPDDATTSPTVATLSFGGQQRDVFSFLLGSPDSFNTVEFFLGGISQGTLAAILALSYGPEIYSGAGAIFVSVSEIIYDAVTFTSSQQAIEFSNISSVPVPAGVLLLGTALAGLGFMSRRNKSKSATASA